MVQTRPSASVTWGRAHPGRQGDLGDYRRGWVDYEACFVTGQLPKRSEPSRRWKGERYDDKRLLIVSEQGFGDAIWIATLNA